MNLLFKVLRSQSGQVSSDDGGSDVEAQGTTEGQEPVEAAQDVASDGQQFGEQTQAEPGAAQPTQETFLSDSDLNPNTITDPKLQAIFKRMQGVYTKRMQNLAGLREKAEQVDRFNSDRAFAEQTLRSWAQQNGYQLAPLGQNPALQRPQEPSAQIVEALKANLAPELQWMAPALAPALQALMGQAIQPLVQFQQGANQQQREAEYDRYAAELAQQVPHWEEHEESMESLYDFLVSPAQFHPQFGSKLRLLYDLATSKAASIAEATKRINGASKNRTTVARGGVNKAPPAQDITKLSKEDAWAAAVRAAKAQVGRTGA